MSVRSAAIWSMAAQYVAFAVQFVVSVIISRYFLSPADFGVFSIALSAAMLISVLQDFGIARYVAGEPNLSAEQIRTCFSVSIIFAFTIGVAILGVAWPVSNFYGDAALFPLLVIIAGSYLVIPFGIVPSALLSRNMAFRGLFFVNVGGALVNGVVAIALAAAGYAALSLAWALVAQAIVRAILAQWISKTPIPWPMTLKGARPILQFGSASSILFVSGAIGTRTPELIIGRILNMAAVGLFGRATSLTGQLRMLVAGAIGGVFYPAFARIRDRGDALGPPYARVVAGYCAVLWPAMAALAVAAEPLVLMLYGERWLGVAPLVRWIALAEIFLIAVPLHVELPILLGKIGPLIRYNIADTIVSIGLLMLAATWGVEEAAMSRVGYAVIWVALYAGFIQKLVVIDWIVLITLYLKSAVATVAAVAPLLLGYWLWVAPTEMKFWQLLVLSITGAILWLITLIVIKHPAASEIHAIANGLIKSVTSRRDARAAK
jgi:O-antigen/teichoic acid export membrane protein